MKKQTILILLAVFGFLSAGLVLANQAGTNTNYYTEDKPNIMVTKDNPQFTVRLKSNPTTGFSWFLREYNSRLITPVKHSFEKQTTKLIGAPTYELWTFKVKPDAFIVPQQLMVKMIYARPFSTDGGSQVIFRISTQGR